MIDSTLSTIRKFIPHKLYTFFQPAYHLTLAFCAGLVYRFPSRSIKVIAVTGTKGKSTTTEILNAILEEAGYTTAVANTIRHKIGNESSENMYKMSMPGRFFTQRFLRKAVQKKCDYAILEITSQGVLQYRHLFINLDAFIFTNISPEHIESHGSFENYLDAKVAIARTLKSSSKKNRVLIVNGDDAQASRFLECDADTKVTYRIDDVQPYEIQKEGIDFVYHTIKIHSPLSGLFNLYNILAAITCASQLGISPEIISRTLEKFSGVRGRVEKIETGQDFNVIVDYAHTPDSLEKVYQVFKGSRMICVLGGTGGGRDTWKRKEMGRIADSYCDEIILTNEDPYDEDPQVIVEHIREGISTQKPRIIMDRREALHTACSLAQTGDTVIITGKGTDPYIMGPQGSKIPWDDATVVREELLKIRN